MVRSRRKDYRQSAYSRLDTEPAEKVALGGGGADGRRGSICLASHVRASAVWGRQVDHSWPPASSRYSSFTPSERRVAAKARFSSTYMSWLPISTRIAGSC